MVPQNIWFSFSEILAEQQRRVLDPSFQDMLKSMNPIHAAMELCTVAFDPGRRTGKTTFIHNTASHKHAAIVVHNRFSVRGYGIRDRVYSPDDLYFSPHKLKGERFNTVYVDEPALVLRSIDKYKLYEMFCRQPEIPTFVLLGRCI